MRRSAPGFLFPARTGRGDGPGCRRRTSCGRRRARDQAHAGHGRARVDSHHELPVVDAARGDLKRDFAPFAALKDLPMAMSAHLLYTAIDPRRPATMSPVVVAEVMRGEIGFDGLILSDDLSMKALKGPFDERAAAVIDAGLDIVLHCNGDLEEARAVASAAPVLAGASLRRAQSALAAIAPPQAFDVELGRAGIRRHHGRAWRSLEAVDCSRRERSEAIHAARACSVLRATKRFQGLRHDFSATAPCASRCRERACEGVSNFIKSTLAGSSIRFDPTCELLRRARTGGWDAAPITPRPE